eukprot:COSAG01_NODE_1532_length_10007_cov_4.889842_1_plen_1018_part_00
MSMCCFPQDRVPYLTIAADGQASAYPMWSHLSRNFIIAYAFPAGGLLSHTPQCDWGYDFDDGASFYDVSDSVLLYANVKTHGAGSKRIHGNLIVQPDLPVDGHGCYTAQSESLSDVFFFNNTCQLLIDPNHPRDSQTGQHTAVLYDFNAHCGNIEHPNATNPLWQGMPHLRNNHYSFPGSAGSSVGVNCPVTMHHVHASTFAKLQAHGQEQGSRISAPLDTSTLLSKAKALLRLPDTAHVAAFKTDDLLSEKKGATQQQATKQPDSDLVWRNDPRQWHQQIARIVDHRFTKFSVMREFAINAKRAGVAVLMLVQVQKTENCPGPWYNGLALCDHINGTVPAADGTLEQWQQLVQELHPMRFMWWTNMAFWSTQGEVWRQAYASPKSDVGQFFSWNATAAQACRFGSNVDGAQGSYRSAKTTGVPSVLGSWCSPTLADYMVDSMANSWTKNLGIQGYTLDCAARYSKGNCGTDGMLQCPDGDGQLGACICLATRPEPWHAWTTLTFGCVGRCGTGWARIVARLRKLQPQVAMGGETMKGWEEVIRADADLARHSGHREELYHTAMRRAVQDGDASGLENTVSISGADSATILCYLHPHYDGRQPGACPSVYYRDTTATMTNLTQHQMWVALMAGSGIVSEHDYDPNSYCTDGFNGCWNNQHAEDPHNISGNRGAWWNVTSDPYDPDAAMESILWIFGKYRSLNRLALRTKLNISTTGSATESSVQSLPRQREQVAKATSNYTTYTHMNCYDGHGCTVMDHNPHANLTAAVCMRSCSNDPSCGCVSYVTADGRHVQRGDCFKRANCHPEEFQSNHNTINYTIFAKTHPPPAASTALVYLKHDAMGPHGDACLMIFNPGQAANLTIDLSMFPPQLFGTVPFDLLEVNKTGGRSEGTRVAPFARAWTVEMGAADMKFFGGFSLGVFAPRQGKKSACVADDHFRRNASGTTLSACFLECSNDAACMNVFVEYDKIAWIGFPTAAVRCTLLGAIKDPSTACTAAGNGNNGTLISRLPGSRPGA